MLDTLISSKTRLKLLLKFFLNSQNQDYLRGLESDFGDSTNSIRLELNKLEDVGLLKAHHKGNRKFFEANTVHPFFKEINSLVRKYVGVDKIIDHVIEKIGDLKSVYITGKLAMGIDSKIMDLVFVGQLDQTYLAELIAKVEKTIGRKIRYMVCSETDDAETLDEMIKDNSFLIWGESIR